MPTLNFQARFADAVESGAKTQTIRRRGKRAWKVGDMAYLHTGQRLKAGDERKRTLGVGRVVEVSDVRLEHGKPFRVDGVDLSSTKAYQFAYADGFNGTLEMIAWFDKTHGLPFDGQMIRWELLI
jgi:hypothetical protein